MRDHARIGRILSALGTYWRANPNHRLGQIVVNLTGASDPFYVEDAVTEAALGAAIAPPSADPEVVAAEVAERAAHHRWWVAAINEEEPAWYAAQRANRLKAAIAERDEIHHRLTIARGTAIVCALLAALSFACGAPRTQTPTTPPNGTPARVP